MPREEEAISAKRAAHEEGPRELQEIESALAAAHSRTAKALERVAKRLGEVEACVGEAEAHAARAEALAKPKADETDRERRLYGTLDRIAETDHRAAEAEQRADETVGKLAEIEPESEPGPAP